MITRLNRYVFIFYCVLFGSILSTAPLEFGKAGSSDVVPIILKFHKVGSTTVTTLVKNLCSESWWNATDTKVVTNINRSTFCCSSPFWHQTIHQYRTAGVWSLKNCAIGFLQGIRIVKVFAIFRDPNAKFLSAMYFFSRWEHRKKLFSTHPANLTMIEFDTIANAALYKRMKAPVQEYAEILGRTPKNLPWGEIVDNVTIEKALHNMHTDIDGVGILEEMNNFIILMALELHWDLAQLPCLGEVNKGKFKEDDSRKVYRFDDLRDDQRKYISTMMVAEKRIYDDAVKLSAFQQTKHGQVFGFYKSMFESKCANENNSNLIHTMRVDSVETTTRTGRSCKIALPPDPRVVDTGARG